LPTPADAGCGCGPPRPASANLHKLRKARAEYITSEVHQKAAVSGRRSVGQSCLPKLSVEGAIPSYDVRRFPPTTRGLIELADWLGAPMWRWRPQVSTGSPCGTSWKVGSNRSWPMRPTQGRARPQERHARCDLDFRPAGAWSDPGELRAAPAHPGSARSDADQEATDARDRAAHSAHPSRARGSQHQTILITDILGGVDGAS
jgi:hypothetical protein